MATVPVTAEEKEGPAPYGTPAEFEALVQSLVVPPGGKITPNQTTSGFSIPFLQVNAHGRNPDGSPIMRTFESVAHRQWLTAAWIEAARLMIATRPREVRIGVLLSSIASAQAAVLRDPEAAAATYESALEHLPRGRAHHALTMLALSRLHLKQRNVDAAAAYRETLVAWDGAPIPTDLDELELHAHVKIRRSWDQVWPRHNVSLLHAMGKPKDAAAALAALGASEGDADTIVHAAHRFARVGARKETLEAADAALALMDEGQEKHDLRLWRLYAQHDLLDKHGAPNIVKVEKWPGEAFERAAQAFLDQYATNEEGVIWYLQLGSTAAAANAHAAAFEFYRQALDNPHLADALEKNPGFSGALLMAVRAGIALERFDETQQMLDLIVRLAPKREKLHDDLEASLRDARARKAAATAAAEAAAKKAAEETSPAPAVAAPPARGPRGELLAGTQPESDTHEDAAGEDVAADASDALPWGWLLGAAGLLLVLLAVATRRR